MWRLLAAMAAMATMLWCLPAQAQEWPTGQVTIIVPFSAGSTPDSLARILAEGLQERLKQPFVVENRAGASGNTGTAAVAKATSDGQTLGVSIVGPLVINALLFPSMPYDTARDIAPISILAAQPSVLVATNGLAAQDVAGLLALLRQEPDKITYGSIGRGSLSHLAMASLASECQGEPGASAVCGLAGRRDGPAARRRAGGRAAGRLCRRARQGGQAQDAGRDVGQALALLPELPTLGEAGIANVEADAWVGLIAPAGISDATLARIHAQAAAVLADPAVVAKLRPQYMSVIASTPEQFRAVLKQEHDRWAPVIAAGGIKAE